MPTTPNGIPYPGLGAEPNVPYDLQLLAEELDFRGPYRMQIGAALIDFSNNANGQVAINFEPGRFTAVPRIFVMKAESGEARTVPYYQGATTAGATLGAYDATGTALTGSLSVVWVAMQMTPTSSDG